MEVFVNHSCNVVKVQSLHVFIRCIAETLRSQMTELTMEKLLKQLQIICKDWENIFIYFFDFVITFLTSSRVILSSVKFYMYSIFNYLLIKSFESDRYFVVVNI